MSIAIFRQILDRPDQNRQFIRWDRLDELRKAAYRSDFHIILSVSEQIREDLDQRDIGGLLPESFSEFGEVLWERKSHPPGLILCRCYDQRNKMDLDLIFLEDAGKLAQTVQT